MDSLSSETHFCTACQATILASDYKGHYAKSDWHRYNVKRRVAGLAAISQALFESQLAALQEKRSAGEKSKPDLSCTACGKTFTSQSAYQSHINSNKHLKKVEAKGKGKSEETEEEEQKSAQNNKKVNETGEQEAHKKMEGLKIEAKDEQNGESKSDEEAGEGEGEGFEDWNDGDAIPLLTCLFCRETHPDQKSSLDHMLKQHGFFIPFVEYLTDLDGFLKYLGEKVGIGRVCIWCNGRGRARFPSVQAVQQHMHQKSHCKIRLDLPEEEEEFVDFYSFPKSEEELEEEKLEKEEEERKKKNPYALPMDKEEKKKEKSVEMETEQSSSNNNPDEKQKRRLTGMNDLGELVLSDGSTVGHRQFKHVYRQNIKPPPQKESQIIALMASSYRQLQLPGYGGGSTALTQSRANNTKKDAPAGFREAWWHHAKRKDFLKVGMAGNIQMHYRAQVQF